MIIVLLGYMASGKSFIGKKLANILEYDFVDLDDFIEDKENKAISEVFERKGEIYFRKLENTYLKELIASNKDVVISLGGGTPCYSNNMKLLLENTNSKTIYLQLAIPNIVERVFNEKDKRPLISHLNTREELTEFVGKHLFERLAFYTQAEITINANNNEKEILESILLQLF